MIFSHGFLMDREMFAPQAAALAPEFRVIAWDERGFGETEFDGQPFTYWDSARDCLGLLDHLGIEQAVLGGMSQGGFLSLRAALLAPGARPGAGPDRHAVGRRGPRAPAAYRQMQETWLQVGPVDELAQAIADLIIGDPELNEIWIEKWQQLPRESMRGAGDACSSATTSPTAWARSPARRSCSTAPPISRSRWSSPSACASGCRVRRAGARSRARAHAVQPDPPRRRSTGRCWSSCARSRRGGGRARIRASPRGRRPAPLAADPSSS